MQNIEPARGPAAALRAYLERSVRELGTHEPEIVHLIAPLALDGEHFPERSFGVSYGGEIDRILDAMASRSRRHAAWMRPDPRRVTTTTRRRAERLEHAVHVGADEGGPLYATLAMYEGGLIAYRRPLYARRAGRSFSLTGTLLDLASTVHFAVDVFAATGSVPKRLGVQTALVNAERWRLAVPGTLHGGETLTPRVPRRLVMYPATPSLLEERSFLEDAGAATAATERAIVGDYR
jgi:hypothetical protein